MWHKIYDIVCKKKTIKTLAFNNLCTIVGHIHDGGVIYAVSAYPMRKELYQARRSFVSLLINKFISGVNRKSRKDIEEWYEKAKAILNRRGEEDAIQDPEEENKYVVVSERFWKSVRGAQNKGSCKETIESALCQRSTREGEKEETQEEIDPRKISIYEFRRIFYKVKLSS